MATPLLQDPRFIADLQGDESTRILEARWGIAYSAVAKYRRRLAKGEPLTRSKEKLVSEKPPVEAAHKEVRESSSDGSKAVEFVRDRPVTLADAREWIKSSGDNPDDFDISVRSIAYGPGLSSNRMAATPKRGMKGAEGEVEDLDLPALYAAARNSGPRPVAPVSGRATVVVYADPQIGKTGRRGTTADLIARSEGIRDKIAQLLWERKPELTILADGGDGIEGFESGGNPMFTNDKSLAQQLDLYGTELFEWVNLLHAYAPVTVMGVPSNHAAWRRGKQNLGTPGDDLGLFMHTQVQRRTEDRDMDVQWVRPEIAYDESVAHKVFDTTLGLVHGNQFGPDKAVEWWQKQAFGAGAVATADVLVTAHYHSFGAGVGGRNPLNQRQRWWLGAPTLDNGSDWFRQTAGRDSDPGVLVFDITEDGGFDLSSLTVVSP